MDVIERELFTNRFRAIANEMGEQLRRTALSTNVKERLDFSCAVLDPAGRLVVNAPHIPVHLGAMGLCVRAVAEALPMGPGDVAITNHPGYGGSHLPDITVIEPVFDGSDVLLGYVANRAHHAEVGGKRPGSMPPDATRLAEEGVILAPRKLMDGGDSCFPAIEEALCEGPWPSRNPAENLADLRAMVASNRRGAEALRLLSQTHGREHVWTAMEALRNLAAEQLRDALRRVGTLRREAEERLDDGSPLRVLLTIDDGHITLDFRGSSGVHPRNLNATPAIVRSVVLYVLRLFVGGELPLNEGLLEPVTLILPENSLLNPNFLGPEAPAVVGGNTEVSQRLTDLLVKALGLLAGSQGTMNNTLFGNARFGYYETVAGGAGAGPGFHGAHGVQVHMTNTRMTDPEVLEHRYPVRLRRFALRRGSGGGGQWNGGDGVVREIEFLEPLALSVLSQHRVEQPYGMEGGQPGAVGRQRLLRRDGTVEELAGCDAREVEAGDRFLLETPGGGGWGKPVT